MGVDKEWYAEKYYKLMIKALFNDPMLHSVIDIFNWKETYKTINFDNFLRLINIPFDSIISLKHNK